jgi:hypothetical protein
MIAEEDYLVELLAGAGARVGDVDVHTLFEAREADTVSS